VWGEEGFGLGIGGWPRMDVRGAWWSIGTGSNGRLDLFSAIRGAHRLTMVCNLIQTTLGLVWLFPKFFPTTLWLITNFLVRLLANLFDGMSPFQSLCYLYCTFKSLYQWRTTSCDCLFWQSPKAVPYPVVYLHCVTTHQ